MSTTPTMGKSCKCRCCATDPYWQKMQRIMCIQYVVLAGIIMPIVLIGSFSYIVPAFIYCRSYTYEEYPLSQTPINTVTVGNGITGTIVSATENRLRQFKTSISNIDGVLDLSMNKPRFTCSNVYLQLNLSNNQDFIVTSDEISPLRIELMNETINNLNAQFEHFSGYLNVSQSTINNANVYTEAFVKITNTSIAGTLSINGSENITLKYVTAPNQLITTGGYYKYTQVDNTEILNISVSPKDSNVHGKSQKICVPAQSFEGKCISIQNKYLSGNNYVRVYQDGVVLEETNKKDIQNARFLKTFSYGEIIKACLVFSGGEFPEPTIQMLNRGSIEVVFYYGELPSECNE